MTCAAAREAILDLAAVLMPDDVRLEIEEHLGGCATCTAEFERQRDLTAALSALAAEAETWASPAIEERLREAFVARIPATPIPQLESKWTGRWIYGRWPVRPSSRWRCGSAAHPRRRPLRMAVRQRQPRLRHRRPSRRRRLEGNKPASSKVEGTCSQRPVPVRAGRAPSRTAKTSDIVHHPARRSRAAGLESGSVVRIAVPVGALPEYGLDAQGGSKTTVDADVLVGQDGLARAIRLVSAEESATQDTRSRR